jgi:hypothetical protein
MLLKVLAHRLMQLTPLHAYPATRDLTVYKNLVTLCYKVHTVLIQRATQNHVPLEPLPFHAHTHCNVPPRLLAINREVFGVIFCLVSETTEHTKACKYRNKKKKKKFHFITF